MRVGLESSGRADNDRADLDLSLSKITKPPTLKRIGLKRALYTCTAALQAPLLALLRLFRCIGRNISVFLIRNIDNVGTVATIQAVEVDGKLL